jgi:vesicular inhibitory amino acid transporter
VSYCPDLTKVFSARPLFSTFEGLMGVGSYDSELANLTIKAIVRILMNVVFVAVAILFPAFDRIMAFLGSALCFTICVIFPLMFYLKIFGNELSMKRRAVYWVVIVISSIMATIGTVFTFIPKEKWDS